MQQNRNVSYLNQNKTKLNYVIKFSLIKCSLCITTSEEKEYYVALFFIIQTSVQNAVFHNFSRQIAFIQYSGPSKHTWTFNQRNHSKNVQNHLYGQPVLTFDKRQICEEISKELRFNVIKDLLSLFSINGFITMCNLKKRLIRSAF